MTQSSFAFRVAKDGEEWYEDDEGIVIREIHKISRLYDVSPVTYPAYQAASSTARSLEALKEARNSDCIKKAIHQKAARERFLALITN
nr:HK97 family phage prohead protease [Phocoenobacter uteri]